MVADLKSLSESLRQSTPEVYLRDMIRARKSEIERTLSGGGTFLLRVPDGRQIFNCASSDIVANKVPSGLKRTEVTPLV